MIESVGDEVCNADGTAFVREADSNRAIATDAQGHELRINDNMKEMDGEVRVLPLFSCSELTIFLGSKRTRPPHPSILLCFLAQSRLH